MSAVDWPAMLAGLERQRAALDDERADIDAVIETIRRRAGPKVTIAALQQIQRAPTRNGKGKRPTAETRGNPKDPKWAPARKAYEAGKPVAAIAKMAGCSVATIYTRASEGKWERPKDKAQQERLAAAAPTPKGQQLPGSVKCTNPECGVMTDYDPCRRCGKKLTRKTW